jgi:hypothetical protein
MSSLQQPKEWLHENHRYIHSLIHNLPISGQTPILQFAAQYIHERRIYPVCLDSARSYHSLTFATAPDCTLTTALGALRRAQVCLVNCSKRNFSSVLLVFQQHRENIEGMARLGLDHHVGERVINPEVPVGAGTTRMPGKPSSDICDTFDAFQPCVEKHPTTLLEDILGLDAIALAAQLAVTITDETQYEAVLARRGHQAQALLNLLQAVRVSSFLVSLSLI